MQYIYKVLQQILRMVIITCNIELRFYDKSHNEFIQLYGLSAKTCHVICNWAVCECTEDGCQAYVQKNDMPYMDGASHKVAGHRTNQRLGGPSCAERCVLCSCSGGARK